MPSAAKRGTRAVGCYPEGGEGEKLMMTLCGRAAAAVSLMIGVCLPAIGAEMASPGGSSSYAMPVSNIDWSRSYRLTPLEMKRLRAKGLSDKEVYVVANAATLTGRPVDSFVDMIFRGATVDQIATRYRVSRDSLREPNPMWQSAEWEQAVKDGCWDMPAMGMHSR
jgi:hypothetical protein